MDDGSADRSLNLLRAYARRDPRVRVVSRPNTGIVGALNDGVTAARGNLLVRMDADDVCHPDRLRVQANIFRREPAVVAAGGQALEIPYAGWYIGRWNQPLTHHEIAHKILHSVYFGADPPDAGGPCRGVARARRVSAGDPLGGISGPSAAAGGRRTAWQTCRITFSLRRRHSRSVTLGARASHVKAVSRVLAEWRAYRRVQAFSDGSTADVEKAGGQRNDRAGRTDVTRILRRWIAAAGISIRSSTARH